MSRRPIQPPAVVDGSTHDSENEEEVVRLLVLGDEKVGKTSVISTLVSQHFGEKVPARLHDVQLPAEENQQHVGTIISDSSCT